MTQLRSLGLGDHLAQCQFTHSKGITTGQRKSEDVSLHRTIPHSCKWALVWTSNIVLPFHEAVVVSSLKGMLTVPLLRATCWKVICYESKIVQTALHKLIHTCTMCGRTFVDKQSLVMQTSGGVKYSPQIPCDVGARFHYEDHCPRVPLIVQHYLLMRILSIKLINIFLAI